MSHDLPDKDDSKQELINEALKFVPSELRCIDEAKEGVELEASDLRLRDLTAKIEHTLHGKMGHAISMGSGGASVEEMQEYAVLIKTKSEEYLKFAGLLEVISKDAKDGKISDNAHSIDNTGEITNEDAIRKVESDINEVARQLYPLQDRLNKLEALQKELFIKKYQDQLEEVDRLNTSKR